MPKTNATKKKKIIIGRKKSVSLKIPAKKTARKLPSSSRNQTRKGIFRIPKIKNQQPLKQQRLILIIVAAFLIFGLILFFINRESTATSERINKFNSENIKITGYDNLIYGFSSSNQELYLTPKITLNNSTENSYQVEVKGIAPELNLELSPQLISIKPDSVANFELKMNLNSNNETLKQIPVSTEKIFNTDIELSVNESLPLSSGNLSKRINIQVPLTIRHLADGEVFLLGITPVERNLVYTQTQKPDLNFEIYVSPLVESTVLSSFYEVNLTDKDGKVIQPLVIREQEDSKFTAKETFPDSFTFNFPPANLIKGGKAEYKLQLIFHAELKGRVITLEKLSSETFIVDVQQV